MSNYGQNPPYGQNPYGQPQQPYGQPQQPYGRPGQQSPYGGQPGYGQPGQAPYGQQPGGWGQPGQQAPAQQGPYGQGQPSQGQPGQGQPGQWGQPELPKAKLVERSLPVVTMESVPGREIDRVIGEAVGVIARLRELPRELRTGSQVDSYAAMLTQSRQDAVGRLVEMAQAAGADAVVGLRFDCSEITQSLSEVSAYGTAVTLKPLPGSQDGPESGQAAAGDADTTGLRIPTADSGQPDTSAPDTSAADSAPADQQWPSAPWPPPQQQG
ncbi:hypothetical protein GCM10009841_05580 [Microlunatus panaciterrae]|uniref:Uncharacterized protein YbjQ (UPF0145 family) n=1 Tax=Microlunatus panaciterrae TaxID=400768 RepID=A0ABS2RJW7_9ACTN|nr:heavy metal-binding domain-containing protein [Microlunatus panaciterrae]MBM7798787.1 uncharacterized protein YbjQ (UPF0145 family) [Microlunatus panaciterrae]